MNAIQKVLLTEADLRDWLGYHRSSDIEARLREMGIKFRRAGKGGTIVTTLAAVNRAIAGNDDFVDIQFGGDRGQEARDKD